MTQLNGLRVLSIKAMVALFSATSFLATAQVEKDATPYEDLIVDVKLVKTEVVEDPILLNHWETMTVEGAEIANTDPVKIIKTIEGLMAIGEKVYKFIEKNQPQVITDYEPISILPTTEKGRVADLLLDTSNWRMAHAFTYDISFKSKFMGYKVFEPVSFQFKLVYAYNGQYKGKGKFLKGMVMFPSKVKADFGYTVSAKYKLDDIMNEGSIENPIAGALISMDIRVENLLRKHNLHYKFYVNGRGKARPFN